MTIPLYNVTDTWNDSSTVFTALQVNVTNTASATGSRLFDFQLGGNTALYLDKTPTLVLDGNAFAIGNPSIRLGSAAGRGLAAVNNSVCLINSAGQPTFAPPVSPNTAGWCVPADYFLGFSNTSADASQTGDAIFYRDAAAIIAQRNSANPQTFRVYNTASGSPGTDYERGVMDWTTTSNVLTIGTQAGGSGTKRAVTLLGEIITVDAGSGGSNFDVQLVSTSKFRVTGAQNAVRTSSTWGFGWGSGEASTTADTVLNRVAAGVVNFAQSVTATPNGWMQWAGQKRLNVDHSVTSSTTLVNIAGAPSPDVPALAAALVAGRTYDFEVYISFTCAGAGGIKVSVAADATLTATDIRWDGYIMDTAISPDVSSLKAVAQSNALGGVLGSITSGTSGLVRIHGTITVNVAGTMQIQFAQNVSNGTATVCKRGSRLRVFDVA